MLMERRLLRAEPSFGLATKLWNIPWLYVLLLCALAGVGYVALYSAGGGSPEPYATRHVLRFCFGLGLMVCIGAGRHPLHRPAVLAALRRRRSRCSCSC